MTTLSFGQIEDLWTQNGGQPALAPTMAAIALAESRGRTDALNNDPSTMDYSVGLWQVNYFGPLLAGRTARYGSPAALAADPNAQARAAVSIAGGGSGLTNWSTFRSGLYRSYLAGSPAVVTTPTGTGGAGGGGAPTAQLASLTTGGSSSSSGPGTSTSLEGCLWTAPTVGVGPVNLAGGGCLVQRGTARKWVGAGVLLAGGGLLLLGTLVLARRQVTKGVLSAVGLPTNLAGAGKAARAGRTRTRTQKRAIAGNVAASEARTRIQQEGALQRQQERFGQRQMEKYQRGEPITYGEGFGE